MFEKKVGSEMPSTTLDLVVFLLALMIGMASFPGSHFCICVKAVRLGTRL